MYIVEINLMCQRARLLKKLDIYIFFVEKIKSFPSADEKCVQEIRGILYVYETRYNAKRRCLKLYLSI
jgi:hypothetical protein